MTPRVRIGVFGIVVLCLYLAAAAILFQQGLVGLSIAVFGVGTNLFMLVGLVLVTIYKPPWVKVKYRGAYLSMVTSAISTALYLHSYFFADPDVVFWLKLATAAVAATIIRLSVKGVKGTPRE